MNYFEVRLINGMTMDFNKKCNKIEDKNIAGCITFKNFISYELYETLAIIPFTSILYIRNITDND